MKQGKVVYTILSYVCLAVLVFYIGYYIYQAYENPLQTAYAVDYEAYDSYSVSGIIVRDEQVIYSNQPSITITRDEGEKVGVGQTVAMAFSGNSARERYAEIEDIKLRINQLEATTRTATQVLDGVNLDKAITSAITSISLSVSNRSMSTIDYDAEKLKNLIFNREYTYAEVSELDAEIAELSGRLEVLKYNSRTDTTEINASVAGIFSSYVDGYERVLKIDMLEDMTVASYNEIDPQLEGTDSAIGKLITKAEWYFISLIPEQQARKLGAGATVRFSHQFEADIAMDVVRVSAAYDGNCLVIFKSDEYLSDTTMLRKQTVDIISSAYNGIRIMKKAVKIDEDGNAGVYCVEGLNAVYKKVKIIYEVGDFYVVEKDKSSTSNLWVGDEVIITGRDLFDGKVIG